MVARAYHNDMLPRSTFVAMLDVLGFKNLVKDTRLSSLAESYELLLQLKRLAARVPVLNAAGGYSHVVGTTVFSDTIVMWCNDDSEALDSLLAAVAGLIALAIDQSWLLRCGVAYGEAVMCLEQRIFIGQPIIDAFRMEQAQKWVGGALHSSCIQHDKLAQFMRDHDCIVPYTVPTKSGRNGPSSEHAIHWGPHSDFGLRVLEHHSNSTNRKRDREKCQNAMDYLHQECQGLPVMDTE